MLYKLIVMTHVFGGATWIGGHIVLVAAVLPKAMATNEPARIEEFERGYGRLGLMALVVQLGSGLWLAHHWIGSWLSIITDPTPVNRLIAIKLAILAASLAIAGYAYHRVLPRIHEQGLRRFAILAWTTTALATMMLILGVGIRSGGLP